jgi:metal-responsive CopG/Arc/MetJ family transcriptional regulator
MVARCYLHVKLALCLGAKCRMMGPIQRVNVDLAAGMLEELDRAAKELNISRQAVIKTLIRQALDQQYLARGSRTSVKRR